MDTILFIIFAVISVVCGFNLVFQKHPISSALSLIGVMGSLAVLYLLLGAEFIAMAQSAGLELIRSWQHEDPANRYNYLFRKADRLARPAPTPQNVLSPPAA